MRAVHLVPAAVLCAAVASCSSGASEGGDVVVVTQYATEHVDGGGDTGGSDTGSGAGADDPGMSDAEAASALASVCGSVDEWQEATHPSLGRVYVGLKHAGPGLEMGNGGCIGAVDAGGNQIFRKTLAIYQDELNFPSPFQDATGNVFVTYNPGRYDGVVTLVPTSDGFEKVGGDDTGGLDYSTTTHMYYYAELVGPGGDGNYRIEAFANDCDPNCAGGTITSDVLSWNGTDYS